MEKLIIFNWKLNPQSFVESERLLGRVLELKTSNLKTEIVVCPPFVYLSGLIGLLKKTSVKLGAQNVFWEEGGAYTGEISPIMLKNSGVEYVIVGHSERRQYLGETDKMINKKVKAALAAGLNVVLCVGESSVIRQEGTEAVKKFVQTQLKKDLAELKNLKLKTYELIVAYEPVWAIGTGISCRPEDAREMIVFIKDFLNSKFRILNSRVLYGGSVDSKNIAEFLRYEEIGGALVGGASLKPEEARGIIGIGDEHSK